MVKTTGSTTKELPHNLITQTVNSDGYNVSSNNTTNSSLSSVGNDMNSVVRSKSDNWRVLSEARNKALSGGLPGMAAMFVQVLSLMWIRTTTNYQYRHGGETLATMRKLYRDGGGGLGGIRRFYRGMGVALIQGPLIRFFDTASNGAALSIMESVPATSELPIAVKTLFGSLSAVAFRLLLMPIDTYKTFMQVEGASGAAALRAKVLATGPSALFHGAAATAAVAFVSHYPWFATYNYLNTVLPHPTGIVDGKEGKGWTGENEVESSNSNRYMQSGKMETDVTNNNTNQSSSSNLSSTTNLASLARAAAIGLAASTASDGLSNAFRVIKIVRQSNRQSVSYKTVISDIVSQDGVMKGLMGRGLKTKIISSAIQGIVFSTLWQIGKEAWDKHVDPRLDQEYRAQGSNNISC
eukprot:CAMPEP_0175059816 /NCGR_PEP_ID=MMETSP0052_2-20121109/12642_1 /TAXON_ID=51329 ORGANISM="Polytomella parva, Strain SAG 63-3" /NCGR_SAMPLE_ID=MMETSP0052_2 /ASSEMBLY_ACC=CAM_ASM_000194 /LENGTH=409 /DNA_ID=CAMNT_0016325407 /DNA_START=532 /DNA_END=1761 /DNA_ORIENTATION=-